MQEFYATYYRPDNIVLSLVGDLDPEKVRPLIEKYFGRLPKASSPLPQVVTVEPKQEGERYGTVKFEAEPSLLMAYHKPTYPDPDDAQFAVLHSLLADGRSSLLERELVQRRQIASSIATSEAPGILFPNLFYVGATPRRGVTVALLRDEIQKVLDRLKTSKVSPEDLEAAKRRVRIDFLKALPSNDGLAEILAQCELLFGDWKAMFISYEQILATTADDIQRLARVYLNIESRTFVEIQTKERTQVVKSDAQKG
jgi:predicted Zn-dependent peptidase